MPGVLGWITLPGAGYLMWLGVSTLRSWRAASFSAGAGNDGSTRLRTFLQGMGTSGINPKGGEQLLLLLLLSGARLTGSQPGN